MKIFLTGGAGFIGAHVARALRDAGHDVHALVLPDESAWRLEELGAPAEIVRGDLGDRPLVDAALARLRPDACVHLAWYAVPGKYLNARENLRSLEATIHLAEALVDVGCKRLVAAGTCFEYALGGDAPLGEGSAVGPTNLYAGCKLAAWDALSRFAPTVDLELAWLRFFYLYGPRESEARLVPAVARALLRGETAKTSPGMQVRDFLHVEDVASAVVRVLEARATGIVNVGSGQPITVRALVDAIGAACGRPQAIAHGALPYRDGDPMFVCADASRLRALGWAPRHDLAGGLKQTVAWWGRRLALLEGAAAAHDGAGARGAR